MSEIFFKINGKYKKISSDKGEKGDKGDAATVQIGNVTTIDANERATVTNSRDENKAVLDFYIPKGDKGNDGVTPNISIGTVTQLEAGNMPTVSATGTNENVILNFGFPQVSTAEIDSQITSINSKVNQLQSSVESLSALGNLAFVADNT